MRYARQIAVPGVGELGQARIAAAEVAVHGDGLAAEICALYLAGAGVKRLFVAPSLAARVTGLNEDVEIITGAAPLSVAPRGDDPLDAGARAARWVLAKILGSDMGAAEETPPKRSRNVEVRR